MADFGTVLSQANRKSMCVCVCQHVHAFLKVVFPIHDTSLEIYCQLLSKQLKDLINNNWCKMINY